jgi:hypothetical protein
VLPALTIGASPRWQNELKYGLGYLPVYYEYFGVATLLALGVGGVLSTLRGRAARASVIGVSLLLAVSTEQTYRANLVALSSYDGLWTAGRYAIEQSLGDGLLTRVPDDSTILVDNSFIHLPDSAGQWSSRYLFYEFAKKRVSIFDGTDLPNRAELCAQQISSTTCKAKSNIFALNMTDPSSTQSTAILSHVSEFAIGMGGVMSALANEATVVERSPVEPLPSLAERSITDVRQGDDFRSFDVATADGPIEAPDMLRASAFHPQFDSGFYAEESNGQDTWRWMKANGVISVVNFHDKPAKIDVLGSLAIFGIGHATVNIRNGKAVTQYSVDSKGVPFDVPATIPPFGILQLAVHTDARRVPGNVDPRDLRLQISNIHISHVGPASGSVSLADPLTDQYGPIAMRFLNGCTTRETHGSDYWHWCSDTVHLEISSTRSSPVLIETLASAPGSPISYLTIIADGKRRSIRIPGSGSKINLSLQLQAGTPAYVTLHSDAARYVAPGDPRRLILQLRNMTVTAE